MRAKWILTGAMVVAAWAVPVSAALAGKPGGGGGGGGGSTPPGTVYFTDLATYDAGTDSYLLSAMDGAGQDRSSLARWSKDVRPSRLLHGGRRWLLTQEHAPGVSHGSYDLIAVRDDGAVQVRLTSAPDMQFWRFEWAPDEDAAGATVGMLGRRWTGPTGAATLVAGSWGFYTAHLSFDGDGNVLGFDAAPAFTVPLGTHGSPGNERPDAGGWSWSPDMTQLVVEGYDDGALRVVDVASGAATPIGPGESPDWSSDGSRIACRRYVSDQAEFRIETLASDGSDRRTVASVRRHAGAGRQRWLDEPRWSPAGTHLVYRHAYFDPHDITYSIHRVAADGKGAIELTPEVAPPEDGKISIAWR